MIAGVAGGLGEYFGVDPTIARLLIVLSFLLGFFPSALAYVVVWAVVPDEPVII